MDGPKDFFYGVKGVGRFEALRLALGYAFSLLCEDYQMKMDDERNADGQTRAFIHDEEGIMIKRVFFMRNENRFIQKVMMLILLAVFS
jgi:hypothetical protein